MAVNKHDSIIVDRSRVETRLVCQRKRYYGYDVNGTGWAKPGHKYEAAFGNAIHTAFTRLLSGDAEATVQTQLQEDVHHAVRTQVPDHTAHTLQEQADLARYLVQHWWTRRWPTIRQDYTVLETEQEHQVTFDPFIYLPRIIAETLRPITMLFRPDVVLQRNDDQMVFAMDYKTTSRASDDWAVHHEQSLQTHLYSAALSEHYGPSYGGIWYEGLVKGYREMDTARSSPFMGQVIQYGSPLYGWHSKQGVIGKYAAGSTRVYLPMHHHGFDTWYAEVGSKEPVLVSTLPVLPMGWQQTVAQMILNENHYQQQVETIQQYQTDRTVQEWVADALMQQNRTACYKYGTKHPCEFVDLCHGQLTTDDVATVYEARVPHHEGEHETV
jgi:hypothetical protein